MATAGLIPFSSIRPRNPCAESVPAAGRARARNWRLRRSLAPLGGASEETPMGGPRVALDSPVAETTAQAIARLDARFPWLRHAERRARR